MQDFRKCKLSFFALALLFFSCGRETGKEEYTVTGEALGTTYSIKYFSDKDFDVEKGLDSLFQLVNKSMSTYMDNSDISRVNETDSTVRVDGHFQEVFKLSREVYVNSGGYFDPTVGNLVNAYGFGAEKSLERIDSTIVDSLLQYVGLEKINITPDGKVIKEDAGIYLEFNAIAKGYAVDMMADYLDKQNVQDYLIELGGELVAKGKNQSKRKDWIVAIDDPLQKDGQRTFHTTLKLRDRAMATSGNYRKFRMDSATGQKYVHTINPLTGYPERSNVLSVSILAENCALADAYATACMAMGLERSKDMLDSLETVDAYIIFSEADEDLGVFATPGFEEVVLE